MTLIARKIRIAMNVSIARMFMGAKKVKIMTIAGMVLFHVEI